MEISVLVSIVSLVLAPVVTVLGFMLRRAFMKLDDTMRRDEVRLLIEQRLDPVYVAQRNFHQDIIRIETKLDKLLDIMIDERLNKK